MYDSEIGGTVPFFNVIVICEHFSLLTYDTFFILRIMIPCHQDDFGGIDRHEWVFMGSKDDFIMCEFGYGCINGFWLVLLHICTKYN